MEILNTANFILNSKCSFTFSKKCLPISVNTISHPTQCGTVLDLCNAHEHLYSLHTNLLCFACNMYTGDGYGGTKLRHVIKIMPNEWWPVGGLDPLSLCNRQLLLQLTL